MSYEASLLFKRFATFTASERFSSSVRSPVSLHITRSHTAVVALVTLKWLLSSMVPHHVFFQMTSCNA